jgi:hypothetical protein
MWYSPFNFGILQIILLTFSHTNFSLLNTEKEIILPLLDITNLAL